MPRLSEPGARLSALAFVFAPVSALAYVFALVSVLVYVGATVNDVCRRMVCVRTCLDDPRYIRPIAFENIDVGGLICQICSYPQRRYRR